MRRADSSLVAIGCRRGLLIAERSEFRGHMLAATRWSVADGYSNDQELLVGWIAARSPRHKSKQLFVRAGPARQTNAAVAISLPTGGVASPAARLRPSARPASRSVHDRGGRKRRRGRGRAATPVIPPTRTARSIARRPLAPRSTRGTLACAPSGVGTDCGLS
jgi:hypothetical protein